MDLSELKSALDKQESAEIDMASTVIAQLNHYRDDIKELADYCQDLVDSQGNKVAIDNFKIGLFKTRKFDDDGETDGIVYLDMLDGKIKIDIRDTSHDLEDLEYGIDTQGPALPMELDSVKLSDCIADDNNFEMSMLATNPNMLIKYAIDNANNQVKNISDRIDKSNVIARQLNSEGPDRDQH